MLGDWLIAFSAIIAAQVVTWATKKAWSLTRRKFAEVKSLRVVSAQRLQDLHDKEAALRVLLGELDGSGEDKEIASRGIG